jgi:hypothetical protein
MLGKIVVQDKLAGFRWWSMNEIYTGDLIDDETKFVPNVGDCVIDDNDVMWRVVARDLISKLCTLRVMDPSVAAQNMLGVSQISRLAPYQQMLRAFINANVEPYTLTLDLQWLVPGSEASYIKVFRGTNVTPDGDVVSQLFDGSGNFLSENVPLVLIDQTNPNLKIPIGFNCSTALQDNEVLTAVVYTIDGDVVEMRGFIVKNTNAIRGLGQNRNYITSVTLVSTLLDKVIGNTINAPANIPISGGNFQAQINYADGSSQLIAVGTNKCKLFGLDGFSPSVIGVESNVALTYYLDDTESAINFSNQNVKAVTTEYKIRAVDLPHEYAFKVFVSPNHNSVSNRYSNDYYLCSLDRTLFIKLTSAQFNIVMAQGGILNTAAYTNSQEMIIVVDMGSVLPVGYNGFLFPQPTTIKYGIHNGVGWILDYRNDSTYAFGDGIYAGFSVLGTHVFEVSSGQTSMTSWLQKLWFPIHALFDPRVSQSPPTPTHMKLMYNGVESPWLDIVTNWNIVHQNYFTSSFVANTTLNIIWGLLESDGVTMGTLGLSPVPLRNTF